MVRAGYLEGDAKTHPELWFTALKEHTLEPFRSWSRCGIRNRTLRPCQGAPVLSTCPRCCWPAPGTEPSHRRIGPGCANRDICTRRRQSSQWHGPLQRPELSKRLHGQPSSSGAATFRICLRRFRERQDGAAGWLRSQQADRPELELRAGLCYGASVTVLTANLLREYRRAIPGDRRSAFCEQCARSGADQQSPDNL
jgi:hypothetical protein